MLRNIKDITFFILITLLAVAAVVYGFTIVPSPFEQRAKNFDLTREGNLSTLQTYINYYNQDNGKLPASLSDVKIPSSNYTYSGSKAQKDIKLDPETNKPYEYKVLTDKSYQLCATFGTDTAKDISPTPTTSPTLSMSPYYFRDEYVNFTVHPKGTHCFEVKVLSYSKFPTPTLQCLGACPEVTPRATDASPIPPLNSVSPTPATASDSPTIKLQ